MAGIGKPWWQRILKRLGIAIIAFIAVAAFQAWRAHDNAAKQLDKYAVGDCLTLAKDGIQVEDTKAHCEKDPSYTVASRTDGDGSCPNDNYVTFEVTSGGDTAGRLCLVENMVAGHCYQTDLASSVTELVDCARGSIITPTVEVLSRQDDGAATCGANQIAITYPEPAPGRTYCTPGP
ncbi:hypothetical protein ACPCIR_00795 [Mycobacterium sp. NPDC051198]